MQNKVKHWFVLTLLALSLTSNVFAEDISTKAYGLVEEMMKLDTSMSVKAYAQAAEKISEDAGEGFFDVVADAMEELSIEDPLYDYMVTTLERTSGELFGEAFASCTATKLSTPALTLEEAGKMQMELGTGAWIMFLEEHLEDATLYGNLYYFIHYDIADGDTYSVAQRESKLREAQNAVQAYMDSMPAETLESGGAEALFEEELDRLGPVMSDADITLTLSVSALEVISETSGL